MNGFLADKRALVTGSSRHLGADIARRLASHGAIVAIHRHTSDDAARAVADELKAITGRDHAVVEGDVTDPDAVCRLVADASERLGGVDVLVNNAGPYDATPFADLSPEVWDRVIDANLRATWLATREVAAGMEARGWGRVVNLSAASAWVRNRAVYGLAKAAISTLTEELALELGPAITVNAVAPGQILESLDELAGLDAEWADRVKARTPLGRLVRRAEVAEVIAQLCGPAFDMMTGVTVPVDGGLRLGRF